MYTSDYNKLFWGMIFIIFNINLGSVNILPDFVGYILIYIGLSSLSSQHPIYNKGKLPSIILAVLTIKTIVNQQNTNFLGLPQGDILSTAIGLISTMINLYLIYIICSGIYLLADNRGLEGFKDSASGRYKAYLVNTIIFQFLLSFSMNMSSDFGVVVIIFVLINIIALISIAALFRRARVELGDYNIVESQV